MKNRKKQRIIIVIPTLRMGGAEKSLISLLNSMKQEMFSVDLFLFEAGGVLQSEVPEWVNIIAADPITRGMALELRYYFWDVIRAGKIKAAALRLWISIRSKLSKRKTFNWHIISQFIPILTDEYDVAIGYLEGAADYFVIDKINAKKKIGWIHSDFSGRALTKEDKLYYSKFDKIVTISNVCLSSFSKVVPEVSDKISVLENIVDKEDVLKKADEFVPDWDRLNGKIHIVTVGRLSPEKGTDLAARAALIIKKKKYNFCWHLYGEGALRAEIEDYIHANDLQDDLILEGLVINPYPYMKNADIIVQPSRWEGKSIVLDEAKILGKAIVVTSYQSVSDQIIDQQTGIITDIKYESIVEGIEEIMNKPELRHKLEAEVIKSEGHTDSIKKFYELINEKGNA